MNFFSKMVDFGSGLGHFHIVRDIYDRTKNNILK